MKFIFSFVIIYNALEIIKANDLGPADITIERIEDCENSDDYQMKIPIEMRKLNRTHAGYSGCIDLFADLNEKAMLNLTAAKWGDGGWKPNAFNFYSDVCKTMNEHVKKQWDYVARAAGLPDGTCPIPKARYCVDKLTLELEGMFPSMLYGKFRVDAMFLWEKELIACVRAVIKSDPSKGGKTG